MTEQQPYDVVEEHDRFELRRYPEHVVAEVTVRGAFDEAGNRAFRPLFRYISGNNRSNRSVAMTAPVVQEAVAQQGGSRKVSMTAPVVQTESAEGEFVVAFVLPADLTEATAPVPVDPDVRVRTVPERLAAARRYSGRWTEATFRHHAARLVDDVQRAGLVPDGSPRYARFNAPCTPWFLRRNEVVQDVRRPEDPS
ncbi:heme-binding protein [Nostocoides sp. F2B08]|uniref:SOUL family heme-binding protein n=1 Tax=Nostocoides sp. F2B08 TaxID=2653936 RepID=UPI0012633DED|nr:heme-binding protein [Tetrasphaera sp. F2B08]KAB7740610.1 heme-binding protein [Tetrasphaera sp. F2B08]